MRRISDEMGPSGVWLRTMTVLALASCTPSAEGSAASTPTTTGDEQAASTSACASEIPEPTTLIGFSGDLPMPMERAVTSFGAARIGDDVYVLGGYFGRPHRYLPEHQSGALSRLPLRPGGSWEVVIQDADGVQGVALVSDGASLYRLGGNRVVRGDREGEVGGGMVSLRDAARFTPGSDTWTPLPLLPEPRSSHAAAMLDGTIYVAGGWTLAAEGPEAASWHRSLLALRPGEAGWRSIDAPFARRALALAAAGDHLVAVGGMTPEGEVSARVDVFDPSDGSWSRGPDFPADTFGVAAVGVGDAIYASARDGVVRRLRPGSDAWEDVGALAFPRFFHQLVPGPDQTLLALGGISGMHGGGRTRWVDSISTSGDESAASFAMVEIASPMAAKNRQGVFLHGETLVVFGGNSSLEQHDFAPERFLQQGWALHVPSLSWTEVEGYPVRRQTMQTVVVGETGISVGGFGHEGASTGPEARSHEEVFVRDAETGRWHQRAGGLPGGGRTQFGLVAHGADLWVFGGLDFDPAREGEAAFAHLTTVLRAPLDDESASFEDSGVEIPGPRRAFAAAMLGDRYVMCGGMREGFQLVDGCVAFDFATRTFTELASPAHTRLSADLVEVGGRLYLVGGSFRDGETIATDPSVEVYDPETNSWRVLMEEVPTDLRHARAMAYGERILIYSAHAEEAVVRVALITP